jgi:hypothetical protein
MTTEKGGRPNTADKDRITLRRAEAVKLRARGKGFQEIADELKIGLATAHLDVRTAMTEIAKEAEENVLAERGTELSRLERALQVVESVLTSAVDGDELQLKALDRLIKIQDQRSKLLGLYSAEKREVSGPDGGPIAIDARAALLERIASRTSPRDERGGADSSAVEPERTGSEDPPA